MLKKTHILVLFCALIILFAAGIVRLMQLRLGVGDAYPPYSTLRTDPLGARAFCESLEEMRWLHVQRFYQDTGKLGDGRNTTLFILGLRVEGLKYSDEAEASELEHFMREGGRIIITLAPEMEEPESPFSRHQRELREEKRERDAKEKPQKRDKDAPARPRKKQFTDDEETPFIKRVSLLEKWAIEYGYARLAKDPQNKILPLDAVRTAQASLLPESLPWHSAIHFKKPGIEWEAIYQAEDRTVAMSRRFGRGSLTILSDSYLFSNEALRNERQAGLLAWMVGSNTRVLFDETHLGVQENPGVASLVLKYRLEGVILAFLLLAALFIWKNAVPFIPPPAAGGQFQGADIVEGRDVNSGLVNLVRRSIPTGEVIAVCFREWKKSCVRNRSDLQARADQMESLARLEASRTNTDRDPVRCYIAMCRILKERK